MERRERIVADRLAQAAIADQLAQAMAAAEAARVAVAPAAAVEGAGAEAVIPAVDNKRTHEDPDAEVSARKRQNTAAD